MLALKPSPTSSSTRAARRFVLSGALFLLVVLASACGERKTLSEWRPEDHQPPPAEPEGQGAAEESGDPTARAARALYAMRCAQCHGEHGHGDGNGRPPGAALPDFASAAFQEKRSDRELYEVIDKGRNMMPPFGQEITSAGIEALIGYIRSLREEK